ncbi:hypothetical protein CDAR_602051 [Caerostris darwini]|uniref:Secreted protein n=1 Tax=Caerostris darwini TaxID=1538125 RepID=A0AAV4RIC3_9ARAC|nr:hypothetical protein CDAR_602051 [Caerostris darwini]
MLLEITRKLLFLSPCTIFHTCENTLNLVVVSPSQWYLHGMPAIEHATSLCNKIITDHSTSHLLQHVSCRRRLVILHAGAQYSEHMPTIEHVTSLHAIK